MLHQPWGRWPLRRTLLPPRAAAPRLGERCDRTSSARPGQEAQATVPDRGRRRRPGLPRGLEPGCPRPSAAPICRCPSSRRRPACLVRRWSLDPAGRTCLAEADLHLPGRAGTGRAGKVQAGPARRFPPCLAAVPQRPAHPFGHPQRRRAPPRNPARRRPEHPAARRCRHPERSGGLGGGLQGSLMRRRSSCHEHQQAAGQPLRRCFRAAGRRTRQVLPVLSCRAGLPGPCLNRAWQGGPALPHLGTVPAYRLVEPRWGLF